MSVYGTPLGVALPAVGDPTNWPGPDYAEQVDLFLEALIERLESKVTEAGLNLTSTWTLSGSALRDLKAVAHTATATPAAGSGPASYAKSDGDWYLMDADDAEIRVTAGGVINVSAVGVTGAGYGAGGVEIYWDGSAQRYLFLDGAGTYADVEADVVYLMDDQESEVEAVGLRPPASAGNYTVTLPGALPAEVGQLAIDNSGNVTVLTGLKHDSVSMLVPWSQDANAVNAALSSANNFTLWESTGATSITIPLHLRAGDRITSLTQYMKRQTSSWTLELLEYDNSDTTSPRYTVRISGSGTSDTWAATTGAPYTLLSTCTYGLRLSSAVGGAGNFFFGVKVTYDRP